MSLRFVKMEGCGNDYVYVDCFSQQVGEPEKLAVAVSDRHFGVGGDGMVLILPSDKADARMRMFNLDGSEGKMCGNAIRCVGKHLHDSGLVPRTTITVETASGLRTLEMVVENGVATAAKVSMGKAILAPAKIPVNIEGDRVVSHPMEVGENNALRITCVSMGNPHCVIFTEQVADLELDVLGPIFERSPLFPEGINTEFVRVVDAHTLEMRVWERGSGETLACGTGACASVVAAVENGYCPKGEDVTVRLLGGELRIRYTDEDVTMTGPARKVFEGDWDMTSTQRS